MDTKCGGFIEHWSIVALKIFKENVSTNFGLIAVFVKVAFEITKRAQHCVLPWFTCFHVFRNRASLLVIASCRVSKGDLQNEWLTKLFVNIQNVANLSALSPVFSSCIIFAHFGEIPRYLEIPPIDFCETSHNRRQAPKV